MRSFPKFVELFEQEAHFWGVTSRLAWILAALPVIFVLGMVAAIPFPDLFVWITAEDSFMEWLQFTLVFTASMFFAWSGFHLLRNQRIKLAAVYLALAFGTFFVAGEEIAWGQRMFGWDTPAALEAVNSQQETTLHNIAGAHPLFVYGMMFAGLYGVLIPIVSLLVWNRGSGQASFPGRLIIPPLFLVPAFLMPFAYRFSRLALGVDALFPRFIFHITKFSEVTEVCFYFALLVLAWLNLRHIRQATSPPILERIPDHKQPGR